MHVPHSVSSISVQQASQAVHRPVCGAAQWAEPRDAEASERCGASTVAGSSASANERAMFLDIAEDSVVREWDRETALWVL